MPGASKQVAIVVPIYRTELDATEMVALRALERHLGQYDRFVVHPIGLTPPAALDGLTPMPLSPRRFRGIGAYSAMLMSPSFYRRFSDYRYILIYQTDCLVFRDALAGWCEAGFSYVGAPWLRKDRDRKRRYYVAVGNGGLSLRHVQDHLRVLQAPRLGLPPRSDQSCRFFHSWRQGKRLLAHWLRSRLSRRPAAHTIRRHFDQAEDMFWAWVDLPDFDPSTATSSLHRIVLQPIDRSGTPTGPLVVVAQTGSANATNLSLHSRRIENRVELLLAWQTAGADVEHTTVHAAALNCQ